MSVSTPAGLYIRVNLLVCLFFTPMSSVGCTLPHSEDEKDSKGAGPPSKNLLPREEERSKQAVTKLPEEGRWDSKEPLQGAKKRHRDEVPVKWNSWFWLVSEV